MSGKIRKIFPVELRDLSFRMSAFLRRILQVRLCQEFPPGDVCCPTLTVSILFQILPESMVPREVGLRLIQV